MKRLPIQRKVEVYGILLRVLMYFNKYWLCTEDLARILGYRTSDGVLRAAHRHGDLLQSHSIKGQIAGKGHAMRVFDEHAVRYLCEYSKRPGAFHLMRWLEEGGMRLDQQPPLPSVQEIVLEEIELADAPEQPPTATSYLVPSVADLLQQRLAKDKAYCRDLVKTMVRYCGPDEVDDLTAMIEARISSYLEAHNCPGLNAARYDLYRKYWLQGGVK